VRIKLDIPSRPTVAKYAPSIEKEMLLIEPWHICHLAMGLLCKSQHFSKKDRKHILQNYKL